MYFTGGILITLKPSARFGSRASTNGERERELFIRLFCEKDRSPSRKSKRADADAEIIA
jgi:hypothetical protein